MLRGTVGGLTSEERAVHREVLVTEQAQHPRAVRPERAVLERGRDYAHGQEPAEHPVVGSRGRWGLDGSLVEAWS